MLEARQRALEMIEEHLYWQEWYLSQDKTRITTNTVILSLRQAGRILDGSLEERYTKRNPLHVITKVFVEQAVEMCESHDK